MHLLKKQIQEQKQSSLQEQREKTAQLIAANKAAAALILTQTLKKLEDKTPTSRICKDKELWI